MSQRTCRDVGVVTVDCNYCKAALKNVEAKTAYNHVFMCASKLAKHVVEVSAAWTHNSQFEGWNDSLRAYVALALSDPQNVVSGDW